VVFEEGKKWEGAEALSHTQRKEVSVRKVPEEACMGEEYALAEINWTKFDKIRIITKDGN
jgi:hypothetical protein